MIPAREFGQWSVVILIGLLGKSTLAGVLPRMPNTTLSMPQQPATGSAAYLTAIDFGNIAWSSPLDIRSPPGETNRLFIVEETGRIIVITNLADPTRTVFLDLTTVVTNQAAEGGLLAMEF